jgi:hypothetical protein
VNRAHQGAPGETTAPHTPYGVPAQRGPEAATAPEPAAPEPGALGAKAAIVCSVLDQGVAALTNILVLVVAARLSSAAGFSVFSMVYTVFSVLLGVETSYVGQALVLVRGDTARLNAACKSAAAFVALASAVIGFASAAVLAFMPGGVCRALAVLGLVLPVVLAQDGLRYCFSALRLPHHALTTDLVRLAFALPALDLQPHGTGAARLVGVWGISALPAVLVSLFLLRKRFRGVPTDLRQFLRRGHLGRRFVVEYGVGNGSSQLATLGLGFFGDKLAVGALRGINTLYGPMNVLLNSATAFGPPLLARVGGRRGQVRATAVLATVLAGVAIAWTVVMMALPVRYGRQVLGATWTHSAYLLAPTGAQYAAVAAGTSALLTLRVLRPRATMPIQVVFSLVSTGAMIAGFALAGVSGAAWGLCVGSVLKATVLWIRIGTVRTGPPGPGAGSRQAGTPGVHARTAPVGR